MEEETRVTNENTQTHSSMESLIFVEGNMALPW